MARAQRGLERPPLPGARAQPEAGLGLAVGEQDSAVGIDQDNPDRLITTGIFAFSRNPIYVAFACVLIGEFLVFPNWVTLIYVAAATALFHRQVLREEYYLKEHYGQEYASYCDRVRRYL